MLQVTAYYTISASTSMKFKSLIHNRTITKWFSFYEKHILDFTAMFCGTALFYNSMLWFSTFDLSLNLNRRLKLAPLWIFVFFDKYILWIIALLKFEKGPYIFDVHTEGMWRWRGRRVGVLNFAMSVLPCTIDLLLSFVEEVIGVQKICLFCGRHKCMGHIFMTSAKYDQFLTPNTMQIFL